MDKFDRKYGIKGNRYKRDICNFIRDRVPIAKNDVDAVLSLAFSCMEQLLKEGYSVSIRGFGKFYPRKMASLTRVSWWSGNKIYIPARKAYLFRPHKSATRRLNGMKWNDKLGVILENGNKDTSEANQLLSGARRAWNKMTMEQRRQDVANRLVKKGFKN